MGIVALDALDSPRLFRASSASFPEHASVAELPMDRPREKKMSLLSRLGVAGFLFFLVKGLLWLLTPFLLLAWGWFKAS
jgi:hypothetical protein